LREGLGIAMILGRLSSRHCSCKGHSFRSSLHTRPADYQLQNSNIRRQCCPFVMVERGRCVTSEQCLVASYHIYSNCHSKMPSQRPMCNHTRPQQGLKAYITVPQSHPYDMSNGKCRCQLPWSDNATPRLCSTETFRSKCLQRRSVLSLGLSGCRSVCIGVISSNVSSH
jgi:hypothetical protein